MWRTKKLPKDAATGRDSNFHMDEILPDYRARAKITFDSEKLNPLPTRIGMEKISPSSTIGKYFVEYASSSTIHGLNHLVAPRRHVVERFLAILFILGALVCLLLLSKIFWYRYQYEATVIILDHETEIFTVSKCSYFLCPIDRVNRSKFTETFARHGVDDTAEARGFFLFLSNVTYETMKETPEFDGAPPEKWLEILHELQVQLYYQVEPAPSVSSTLIVTERGICLALRNFASVYSSFEYWKQNNWSVVTPPASIPYFDYANDRGSSESIEFDTDVTMGMYDPGDILEYRDVLDTVHHRDIQRSTLTITETVSEEKLRQFAVHQRNCKFHEDGGLELWPIYTFKMCIIDCRYRTIRARCGCQPHFARPMPGVAVCDSRQLRCIGDIVDHLFPRDLPPARCDCPVNCNTVIYSNEDVVQTEQKAGSPKNTSAVTVLLDFPRNRFRRVEVYGLNDFLTSVGGAAGLFLGASVLSFVEIVYFGTLRLLAYRLNLGRTGTARSAVSERDRA